MLKPQITSVHETSRLYHYTNRTSPIRERVVSTVAYPLTLAFKAMTHRQNYDKDKRNNDAQDDQFDLHVL